MMMTIDSLMIGLIALTAIVVGCMYLSEFVFDVIDACTKEPKQ